MTVHCAVSIGLDTNCYSVLPHDVALPAPNNCQAQAPRQVTASGGCLLTNLGLDWLSRISACKV